MAVLTAMAAMTLLLLPANIIAADECVAGGACLDDKTSFIQISSSVHKLDNKSPEDKACQYDTELGSSLVLPVLHTAALHATWQGDQAFVVADMCERRGKNAVCQSKTIDECNNGCEWHVHKHLCETLEIDTILTFAQAHPQSAFALYASEVHTCAGNGKRNCDGDCQWDAIEKKCNVAHPAYHRVMCSPAWQSLMGEVKQCESETPGACHKLGCTVHSKSPGCKKWFSLVFGQEEGQSLLNKVSSIEQTSCGNGEHSAKCKAVIDGAKVCAEKGKAGVCENVFSDEPAEMTCKQDPTECRLSASTFASICSAALNDSEEEEQAQY